MQLFSVKVTGLFSLLIQNFAFGSVLGNNVMR